eukprot:11539835-Heterocapsa_arctica.AAC.1
MEFRRESTSTRLEDQVFLKKSFFPIEVVQEELIAHGITTLPRLGVIHDGQSLAFRRTALLQRAEPRAMYDRAV